MDIPPTLEPPTVVDVDRAAERGGGNWGILPWAPLCLWAPKRSIYSNRTVKYSIKAVTTYILPWAPQALSAALDVDHQDLIDHQQADDCLKPIIEQVKHNTPPSTDMPHKTI